MLTQETATARSDRTTLEQQATVDPLPTRCRFHGLRHYYASLLIRHGESVKTVQARLAHATAAETLDTYSHLRPDSDDRTREASTSSSAPLRLPAD